MAELTRMQSRWVEDALPRVEQIARSVHRQVGVIPIDDLISAGHEALVRAAIRYDPETGVPFPAFAHYRIRGAMIDAVRSHNPTVRARNRAERKLEVTQSLLEEASRRSHPTTPLEAKVAAARDLVRRTSAAVLLTRNLTDPDNVATGHTTAETELLDQERRDLMAHHLRELEPDDRALIEAIYRRGTPMRTYAKELGVNASTISRRHARILAWMAERLRGA